MRETDLEIARQARTREADRRAAEAGAVNRAARCVCGCSGINHLDVMTDTALTGAPRIPCAVEGCTCDDLAYTSERADQGSDTPSAT
ncbi:hypothetical protein [Streptomyces triticagri]|nr:hypothetical protein [Streptomyces triticagri]